MSGEITSKPDPVETTLGKALKLTTLLKRYGVEASLAVGALSFLGYQQNALGGHFPWTVGVIVAMLPLAYTFVFKAWPNWRDWKDQEILKKWSLGGREISPGYFRLVPYEEEEEE